MTQSRWNKLFLPNYSCWLSFFGTLGNWAIWKWRVTRRENCFLPQGGWHCTTSDDWRTGGLTRVIENTPFCCRCVSQSANMKMMCIISDGNWGSTWTTGYNRLLWLWAIITPPQIWLTAHLHTGLLFFQTAKFGNCVLASFGVKKKSWVVFSLDRQEKSLVESMMLTPSPWV